MASGDAPERPGADRPHSLFAWKRRMLAPLIWYRRRQHPDLTPKARRSYEARAYSRDATAFWEATTIDPAYLHRAHLDENSVIFDVGAAFGDGAATMHDLYGATVYAFEPQPHAFQRLERRFADNPKVHALPYGLGSSDATLPMELAGMGSTIRGTGRGTFATTDVQIRDIVSVVDELGVEKVDLIKINIEGGEFDLLPRIVESGLNDRIRYFLIQFHEWYEGAHLGRWRFRRAIRSTHDEVWCYKWIFELWCSKAEPHPEFVLTPESVEELRAALIAAHGKDPTHSQGTSSPDSTADPKA